MIKLLMVIIQIELIKMQTKAAVERHRLGLDGPSKLEIYESAAKGIKDAAYAMGE